MSFYKRIIKNTFVGWITVVVSMGARFISLPLILNALGKNQYATYALVTSLVNYLYLFDTGISGAVCRLYSLFHREGDKDKWV